MYGLQRRVSEKRDHEVIEKNATNGILEAVIEYKIASTCCIGEAVVGDCISSNRNN